MRHVIATLVLASVVTASPAFAAPCPADLPVLFIVQDKSGSMNEPPDKTACPTCPTKWASAKAAVSNLTSTFANRFRFGLELYPHDSTTFNCTTGTTVSGIGSSSTTITNAYAAVAPGGGTPTAVSLDAARTYLKGQNLATPAYVLLITDGLPNCNLALDSTSCTATTAGCANNACGLGSKDCLDDSETRRAARDLLAAGFKVYVVGFGTSATGNNQTVLNGVASSGGTGSAYAANDQTALNNALNQIAFNATTCCKDVCTAGAKVCTTTGDVKECKLDSAIGCTNWFTSTCGTKSYCSGGSCTTCSDACTLGAKRCQGSSAQTCVTGAYGCAEWQETEVCGYGELCQGGSCTTCQTCSWGSATCVGNDTQTCVMDVLTGCTKLERKTCASGSLCAGGSCVACNTSCTAGTKRCNGATPETCSTDANGCTVWKPGTACTDFCSGGVCGACGTSCTVGAKRCNGNGVETCVKDANGCSTWTNASACQAGTYCANGACLTCATSCALGAKRCSSKGVEECKVDALGCNAFVLVSTCVSGETCAGGVCVPPCKDECSQGAAKCDTSGKPMTCERAATGCTVWHAKAACATTSLCVEGSCREKCNGGEIETCKPGYVCTGRVEGRVCLPEEPAPEAATEEQGGQLNLPDEQPQPAPAAEEPVDMGAAPGCGCAAADGGFALMAIPLLGVLLRRRRE